jgi:hypothetical protein
MWFEELLPERKEFLRSGLEREEMEYEDLQWR